MIVLSNSVNSEATSSISSQPNSASDNYDFSETNVIISSISYYYVYMDLSLGERIEFHFETENDNQGIDFFICNQENFDLWEGGFTSYGYNIKEDIHSSWDSFLAPSADTWYIILINREYFSSVKVDLYIDDGTNTPYKFSASHTMVGNHQILESDEYLTVNLDALKRGTSITVNFETYFSTDGIDFFICSAEEFANFRNDNTFTSYEYKFDLDTGSVSDFKVPKKGDWVVVFYAEDQADTISFCYSIDLEDPTFLEQFWYIFVILGVAAIGSGTTIAIIYNKRKKVDGKTIVSGTLNDIPMDSQPSQQLPEDNQNLNKPQNFQYCMKCGEENPSLDRFCKNCGTDLSEPTEKMDSKEGY